MSAARKRAEEELAQRTTVPSDYYDELLAALDVPPRVIPELLDALRSVSRRPGYR